MEQKHPFSVMVDITATVGVGRAKESSLLKPYLRQRRIFSLGRTDKMPSYVPNVEGDHISQLQNQSQISVRLERYLALTAHQMPIQFVTLVESYTLTIFAQSQTYSL